MRKATQKPNRLGSILLFRNIAEEFGTRWISKNKKVFLSKNFKVRGENGQKTGN